MYEPRRLSSRIGLHFVRARSVGVPSGYVVSDTPGLRRHRRPTWVTVTHPDTELLLWRARMVGEEGFIRFRAIQYDSYTCRCVLLTYRHTDCANKRADSNE